MNYLKSFAMVVAAGLVAVASVLSGGITPVEWVTVLIALTGAAAVFTAPNVPGAKYTKEILAALAAVLAFLVSAIVGGVNGPELIQIAIIVLGALGVVAAPYTPSATVSVPTQ